MVENVFLTLHEYIQLSNLMTSLYLLQFACLLFTGMLALMLLTSLFHVDVVNAPYERSRWSLFAAMILLVIHYSLQMVCGFRAESDDMGTIVNILFYTPVTFLVAHSILNIECARRRRWQYDIAFIVLYVAIFAIFVVGLMGRETLLYTRTKWIMHVLFLLAMVISIFVPMIEIRRNQGRVEAETGADISSYNRYTWSGYYMLCISALFLVIAIIYRPLLFIFGPLLLLSLFVFIFNFIALGYNIKPFEQVLSCDASEEVDASKPSGEACDEAAQAVVTLSNEQIASIEQALAQWCDDKRFRESDVNMSKLSQQISVTRRELSIYFEQYLKQTFRVWLSDLRFAEAQRLILAHPNYSNESISSVCGFSSRSQLYKMFSTRLGMTPREWREQQAQ